MSLSLSCSIPHHLATYRTVHRSPPIVPIILTSATHNKQNGRVSPRTSGSQHSGDGGGGGSGGGKAPASAASSTNSHSSSSPVYATDSKSMPFGHGPHGQKGGLEEKRSPQQQVADSHAAKTNRMEAPSEVGYGGGIPAAIEEGVEPEEM